MWETGMTLRGVCSLSLAEFGAGARRRHRKLSSVVPHHGSNVGKGCMDLLPHGTPCTLTVSTLDFT